MLGLDIGSIFVGSVFSVYACCAIHVILSDRASVSEVNADISLKDRTAENIVINECSFED